VPLATRDESRSMFGAAVHGPASFTVLAVWAQREPSYSEALRRGVHVYRDLLRAGPVVLAGDLNSSVAWDARHGRTDHLAWEAELRDEFGLVSAYHAVTGERPGAETRPTHYWRWQESSPYHIDFCYVPQAWVLGLQSVSVGSFADWADASDHRPLIVDVVPTLTSAAAAV
jgi:endonuclease/exonuclease/phosphatase family metal-dependent hydrolase